MINTDVLQSSSAISGFGFTDRQLSGTTIAAGQTVLAFTRNTYTFNVLRKDPETVIEALAQLVGPSTADSTTHDKDKWKRIDGGGQLWGNVDGTGLYIIVYVYYYTPTLVVIGLEYLNTTAGDITYNTAVTINVKADFFKYPWG